MPPSLILVRHAEALHNIHNKCFSAKSRKCNLSSAQDYSISDPELSAVGIEQCGDLRGSLKAKLPSDLAVGLIVSSPMRRTIQTALIALDWLIDCGTPVQFDAKWQENSSKPCDTGSPIAQLKTDFPSVDFSGVDPVYPDKISPSAAQYAFTRSAILARAQAALHDLYHRPEEATIVVSHSAFMRFAVTGTHFANADFRIFDFASRSEPNNKYRLVERESTKTNCGGRGYSLGEEVEIGSGDLPPDEALGYA
ncbi:MAG: hypothetical protein Q9227_005588 [Pyrenula ochraceoflavens]